MRKYAESETTHRGFRYRHQPIKLINKSIIQVGESSSEKVIGAAKKLFRGVQGVENIYTQHVPPFRDILESVAKGRADHRLKNYGPNPQVASV